VLARFASAGEAREVLAMECAEGSVLVLDCRPGGLADARVVGRIVPQEPPENASLLARMYANDERRGRPRVLRPEDLDPAPTAPETGVQSAPSAPLLDADGRRYAIATLSRASGPELRWMSASPLLGAPARVLSLRETIGALESYEPPLSMTEAALAASATGAASRILRAELDRVRASAIVLNRALREAVAGRIAEGVTLSEIALRCGRVKRDRHGNLSGETSWLARRIGRLPESGQPRPTPWIHSKTLALIARGRTVSARRAARDRPRPMLARLRRAGGRGSVRARETNHGPVNGALKPRRRTA
jgi:hypothetical protein